MKSLRSLLAVALVSMATAGFAQSDAPKTSDSQKTFEQLKTLAGTWQGSVAMDPPDPSMDMKDGLQVTLRVTSRGNALVHEMQDANKPLDPTKYDHPVTMIYLDSDKLTLVHYCDAGNRPRMTAKASPDGKKVEFEFLDLSGGNQFGHMYHAVFTTIDANHHVEDWTYLLPGDKPMHAHMDLKRVN